MIPNCFFTNWKLITYKHKTYALFIKIKVKLKLRWNHCPFQSWLLAMLKKHLLFCSSPILMVLINNLVHTLSFLSPSNCNKCLSYIYVTNNLCRLSQLWITTLRLIYHNCLTSNQLDTQLILGISKIVKCCGNLNWSKVKCHKYIRFCFSQILRHQWQFWLTNVKG